MDSSALELGVLFLLNFLGEITGDFSSEAFLDLDFLVLISSFFCFDFGVLITDFLADFLTSLDSPGDS
jgi:hypothetical protein